jgi:large subunit ribosomal protein L21
MFAIVKTGGKQYRVAPGDQITVERIVGEVGSKVALGEVLAIGDAEASTIGRPTVPDVSVRAKIVQQPRGGKIIVFKKKRRKNYRRKRGHRQELTVLRIEEIGTAAPLTADSGATNSSPSGTETDQEASSGA